MQEELSIDGERPASTGKARGGRARAEALSPERRREIAAKANAARWSQGEISEAICGSADRPLRIGDVEIECYVLADDTRVITQTSMLQAIGRPRRLGGREEVDESLPPILQGKAIRPFIPDDLIDDARPVPFRLPNGTRASGYRAEILPALCEVYLVARAQGKLPANQTHIAAMAEVLVRGLARVGIIALVDEATGYQDMRTRDALTRILEAFVDKELQPWVRTFPPDFYREMFRLRGLEYKPESVKRPQYFGVLTSDIVYKRLAPGVLDELKTVQKKGTSKGKLFQHLTSNVGYPKLLQHLGSVVTLMRLSTDWSDFKGKLDEIHPLWGEQLTLFNDRDFGL